MEAGKRRPAGRGRRPLLQHGRLLYPRKLHRRQSKLQPSQRRRAWLYMKAKWDICSTVWARQQGRAARSASASSVAARRVCGQRAAVGIDPVITASPLVRPLTHVCGCEQQRVDTAAGRPAMAGRSWSGGGCTSSEAAARQSGGITSLALPTPCLQIRKHQRRALRGSRRTGQ